MKILVTASHYEELCREAKELFESKGYELIINKKEKAYSLHYHFLRLSKISHFLMSLFV